MITAEGKRIDRAEAVEPIDMHVGARIRLARETMRGMSRVELAPKIGYSAKQIGKWESGENRVFVQALFAISKALALPFGWFVEGMTLDAAAEHAAAALGVTAEDMQDLMTPDSVALIQQYAGLSPKKQRLIRQMMKDLSATANEGGSETGGEAHLELA